MRTVFFVTQIVFSILLVLAILSQQRGSGLSETFGGSSTFYTTKRGAEKVLSVATIVLAVLFVANSVAFIFVR